MQEQEHIKNDKVSECCGAAVTVRSSPPWVVNPQYQSTNYYVCEKCGQPCDVIERGDDGQTTRSSG
jgi:hypothetical protein